MDYQTIGAYIDKVIFILLGLVSLAAAIWWTKDSQKRKGGVLTGLALILIGVAQVFLMDTKQDQLERMIKKINEGTPRMIDEDTRLDRVEMEENRRLVIYHTLVGLDEGSIRQLKSAGRIEEFKEAIRAAGKKNPQIQKAQEAGLILVYQYHDEKGEPVITVEL